jgi:MoaA/NifB/PqqE/SkfB family radical SAM enzyme
MTDKLPAYYTYYTIMRCNMACPRCYQRSVGQGREAELSFNEAAAMFDRVRSIERVNLIGGEVFIRRDFCDLLDYFDGRGVMTSVTTNSVLINDADLTCLASLDHLLGITVSLDALSPVYNAIRGTRTTSDRVLDVIRSLLSITAVGVNAVLLPENVRQFEHLIETLTDIGVCHLKAQLLIAHSPAVVEATERMMNTWFDNPIRCMYPRALYRPPLRELQLRIQRIRAHCQQNDLALRVFPEELTNHLGDYAEEKLWHRHYLTCESFERIPRVKVLPNGDVIGCEGLGYVYGNLRDHTPEEIWASERRRVFEARLEQAGDLPICGRCCRVVVGPAREVAVENASQIRSY